MTQSRVVTQVSGPGRSRGAAMDGAAMNSSHWHDREAIQHAAAAAQGPQ
jgi:hypothetical protein